jgi:hypothetical protein
MIKFLPEGQGNVVGIQVSGKLTDKDYKDALIPELEALFARHGKLRVLLYMDEAFEGWNLDAAWDDAALGLGHRNDFEKMALVGAPQWVEWGFKLSGFLMRGEMKLFAGDQLDEAWAWVKE